jgi:hypothetical protein
MSLLVVQLPARERLGGRAGTADDGAVRAGAGAALPAEWAFVLSDDGREVRQSGVAAVALLPRADQRVLVLAAADVAWHRIDIPKAPAPRLRAALAGVLEEALLDDAEALHLALAAGAAPGRAGWPPPTGPGSPPRWRRWSRPTPAARPSTASWPPPNPWPRARRAWAASTAAARAKAATTPTPCA